ncbi:MAG: hypothetical protein IJ480_10500 [Clostridia bacterium]|nr:hypothetical protein [Clostridia bacterium]
MESSRKGELTPAVLLIGIGKAQLLFLLTGTALLLLFCRIAYSLEDPESVTEPLSLLALCLASLAGGIGAVRFTGDGILSGLISGVVTMALVRILAALPFASSGLDLTQTILFCCLIPVFSVCGAVLGKKRRKQTKHKRR